MPVFASELRSMTNRSNHHILTVGWHHSNVHSIWTRVATKTTTKISHLVHPRLLPEDWPSDVPTDGVHFFKETIDWDMPPPDRDFLRSLERDGVPTIHNMIISDRVISKLDYDEALSYSTLVAKKLVEAFSKLKPTIVIGGWDSVHGSLAFAVCKHLNIPWFCFHFSVIPFGMACFCDALTPAARVDLRGPVDEEEELRQAQAALEKFEAREIEAIAYIAPKPRSIVGKLIALPKRIKSLFLTLNRRRRRPDLKYTDMVMTYSVSAAVNYLWQGALARRALTRVKTVTEPPQYPYAFFGFHMQPESSIDVWAHYYSNQIWVLELLARSIPPSHKLLVKIHKSDISSYSRDQLDRITSFPGVEIVEPFADTIRFIKKADLIVSIQGTIGLEGALFGKPVIMLGDSPNVIFEGVSRIGEISDLPDLIKQKLNAPQAGREEIIRGYAKFMAPFMLASNNYWDQTKTEEEIDGYVELTSRLEKYVDKNRRHAPT